VIVFVHDSTSTPITACRGDGDKTSLIPPEQIEQAILLIRGQRVMLDRDLAALYGVETKNVKEDRVPYHVKRKRQ